MHNININFYECSIEIWDFYDKVVLVFSIYCWNLKDTLDNEIRQECDLLCIPGTK